MAASLFWSVSILSRLASCKIVWTFIHRFCCTIFRLSHPFSVCPVNILNLLSMGCWFTDFWIFSIPIPLIILQYVLEAVCWRLCQSLLFIPTPRLTRLGCPLLRICCQALCQAFAPALVCCSCGGTRAGFGFFYLCYFGLFSVIVLSTISPGFFLLSVDLCTFTLSFISWFHSSHQFCCILLFIFTHSLPPVFLHNLFLNRKRYC